MKLYAIGTKVRVIAGINEGREGVIVEHNPRYGDYLVDIPSNPAPGPTKEWICYHQDVTPITDLNEPVAWEDCKWQPKHLREWIEA